MQKNLIIILCCFISFMHGAQQTKEKIIVQIPSLETMQQRLQDSGKADGLESFFDQITFLSALLDRNSTDPIYLDSVVRLALADFHRYYDNKNNKSLFEGNEDHYFKLIKNALSTIIQCILSDQNFEQDLIDQTIRDEIAKNKAGFDPKPTYYHSGEPILKSSLPSLETMKKRLCDAKNADDFKDFFDKSEYLQELLAYSDDSVTLDELTNYIVPDLFQNYYGAEILNEDDAIPLIEKGLPIIMQCIVPNINQDIVNKAIHDEIEHQKESIRYPVTLH